MAGLPDRRAFDTIGQKLAGASCFGLGPAKKVLPANVPGEQADLISKPNPATLPASTAWLGALARTFQVYFNPSSYASWPAA